MLLARAFRLRRGDLVSLTGGGGKTTLMFRLADELVTADWRVLTTMTTRIFVGQMSRAPARLMLQGEGALLAQLPAALTEHRHVLVAGGAIVEQDKVEGVSPDTVDRIAANVHVDAVIVEADGSRRLPFKAPAAHEPVVPAATTLLVPMAGLDAIGRPLTAEYVHRPAQVVALTSAREGDSVTPELVAAVLAHPDGGAKGLPAGARLAPFLNKADDPARLMHGREIARLLLNYLCAERVIIGALESPEPVREVWTRVGAVVLAAGGASRFGALKQLAPWRGRPLVTHAVEQALTCPELSGTFVTVGAEAEAVCAALAGYPVATVNVPDWAAGQSRSVQAGLNALLAAQHDPGAAIFLLVDQPGVTPELLSALVQRHRETLAPVVAPRYQGRRGNPVLFDRAVFHEFVHLSGDIGARPIIQAHADEIAWVDWPTPEVIQDIDTPADLDQET